MKFLKLISDHRISRHMASLIFQLRVGHAPLNSYLFRFKRADNERCPACGEPKETAEHFLLRCPGYAYERWTLREFTQKGIPKMEELLANPKAIMPIINFIQASSRFETSQ
jgi:hypothetical protein